MTRPRTTVAGRFRSRQVRAAIAGVLIAGLALSACGSNDDSGSGASTLDKIKQAGVAKVALASNPPYSELGADGKATGYAPALALAVLSSEGVTKLEPSVAEFQGLIPGLQANRWDIITTGLSVTASRCETILFSEPTVVQHETLTVLAGNPKNITSHQYFLDHPDAKLAVLTGSSQQQYAVEQQKIPEGQVLAVSDPAGMLDALLSGRVDAFAIGEVSAMTASKPSKDKVEIIPLDYIPVYGTAFGFRKDDTALRDFFNTRMKALHDSGEFKKLYEEWGFTNYDVLAKTTLNDLVPGCN